MPFEDLASRLKFSKIESFSKLLSELDLEYRKGKTVDDVRTAIRKAHNIKNGMAKTEVELQMLELYLKQVLKKSKVKSPE